MRSVPHMKDSWEFSAKEFVRGEMFPDSRQSVSVPTGKDSSIHGCKGTGAAGVKKFREVMLPCSQVHFQQVFLAQL